MDLQLDEKNAIVLASSRGIGRASAKVLAEEGATVVISSSNRQNLREAKEHIVEAAGVDDDRIIVKRIDLSEPDTIADTISGAIEELGGLDILVTNTGGPPKIGFEEATLDQFDEAYVLMLKSIIVAVDAALPAIRERGGAITNLIATTALEPEADHILANTIRPGVYGFAKSLAAEYAAEGVRVNNVCPRKVGPLTPQEEARTTHIDRYAEEHGLDYATARERFIAEIIPLGTAGDLDDFGKAVAFISSPVASHITGHSLNVDGGWSDGL